MLWIQNPTTEPEHFINDFMGGSLGDYNNQEYLREKFRCGYCYYFAHMLKTAFGRGTVCWTAPLGHFVWVDDGANKYETNYDKIKTYDIEGKYNVKEHDVLYLIPEEFLNEHIKDFLHTPDSNKSKGATKIDLIKIVKNYCKSCQENYYEEIENYFS